MFLELIFITAIPLNPGLSFILVRERHCFQATPTLQTCLGLPETVSIFARELKHLESNNKLFQDLLPFSAIPLPEINVSHKSAKNARNTHIDIYNTILLYNNYNAALYIDIVDEDNS